MKKKQEESESKEKKKKTSKDGCSHYPGTEKKLLLLIESHYSFDAGGLAGIALKKIEMLKLKQRLRIEYITGKPYLL